MTAQNFLDVLEGKAPAVLGSSGKTIKSGPDDRVFVFFADHGAPGEVVCRGLLRQVLAGLASWQQAVMCSRLCCLLAMDLLGGRGQENPGGLAGRTLLAAGGAALLSRVLIIRG